VGATNGFVAPARFGSVTVVAVSVGGSAEGVRNASGIANWRGAMLSRQVVLVSVASHLILRGTTG
jgi:hypothetical protein